MEHQVLQPAKRRQRWNGRSSAYKPEHFLLTATRDRRWLFALDVVAPVSASEDPRPDLFFFQEGWELSPGSGQDVGKWLPCHPSRLHSSSAQLLSSCRAGLAAPPISCAKGAARCPPSSAEEPAAAMVELFSACLLPWLARRTPRRRGRSRGGRGRGSICAQRRLQSQQI